MIIDTNNEYTKFIIVMVLIISAIIVNVLIDVVHLIAFSSVKGFVNWMNRYQAKKLGMTIPEYLKHIGVN